MPQSNTSPSQENNDSPRSRSSSHPTPKKADPQLPDTEEQCSNLTESRLWMKTVIDAIHEDIQNRSRSEQETTSPQSSQNGSSHSSGAEKKKDSRELKRIESFMADATDITALIDGDIDEDAARRRMAEKLNEFDEMFEGAGKNKTS